MGDVTGDSFHSIHLADIESADTIVLVEGNLAKTHPRATSSVLKAIERGARLIAIGCARTQMVRLASCFLQVAPGCEGEALNGLLAAVVRAGLVERRRAADSCTGYDSLRRDLADVNTTGEMRAAAEWIAAERGSVPDGTHRRPRGPAPKEWRGIGLAGRNHRIFGKAGQRVAAAVGAEQRTRSVRHGSGSGSAAGLRAHR
jgi:anaerobic selenocysteine-containing dehydrogenase